MKYPNLYKRLQKLENETYSHTDNVDSVYSEIMLMLAVAKPQDEAQSERMIYSLLSFIEEHYYETIDEPLPQFDLNEAVEEDLNEDEHILQLYKNIAVKL